MKGRVFIDTNVLVYCYDEDEPEKRERALGIFEEPDTCWEPVLSTQVLQEFYVAVVRKLARPLDEAAAEQAVAQLARLPVVQIDAPMVLAAIALSRRHQLSLWDALILEAARSAGCPTLLTEDLQPGFRYQGVTVENPFRGAAG
ncbi:MAG: PIN domain-containing protein [bacterium]